MTAAARLMMFWDYDTQWGGDRSRMGNGPKAWGRDEFSCAERLLELHAKYAIPACFAVVGAAALPGDRPYHDPVQIREIHAAGHEIASHSMRHEWLPGLAPVTLDAVLRQSRATLEDCIGAPVTSFVPPYNQPWDFPRRGSFSRSERRAGDRQHVTVEVLCAALRRTGYRFARVSWRSLAERARDALARRRLDEPGEFEIISGLTCARLNTPGGFAADAVAMVRRCVEQGRLAVVYGHPHSLHSGNTQDERHLIPFFDQVRAWVEAGRLQAIVPRAIDTGAF